MERLPRDLRSFLTILFPTWNYLPIGVIFKTASIQRSFFSLDDRFSFQLSQGGHVTEIPLYFFVASTQNRLCESSVPSIEFHKLSLLIFLKAMLGLKIGRITKGKGTQNPFSIAISRLVELAYWVTLASAYKDATHWD